MSMGRRPRDLSGQKFGLLTAMYPTERRDHRGSVYWHCVCECGNEIDVSAGALMDGNNRSCGFRHYHPDAYEECFIPTYEKYRKVKGQPTKQLAHLLPGYLFFVSDHPQELQKLLKRIPEFAKTLGDDDGAIPLYQEEVEFLQKYTDEERILKMSEGYLVGSELVVTDGPLKDYQGKVMKIDRHKRTAVLELEFLGRKTKVTVGLEVVRKVNK